MEDVTLERRDGVGWLTINRPSAKNALTKAMYARVRDICREVWVDEALYALVLQGTEGAFAVGGDLKEMLAGLECGDRAQLINYEEAMPFETLSALPKPTVALVDGLCMGGGLTLALVCDISIATTRSKFAIPEATMGICDAHMPRLLREWVPPATLRYWLYTGATFTPAEAMTAGLLTKVVEPDELEATAATVLAKLKASSAGAIQLYKTTLNESRTLATMHDAYVTMLGDDARVRLTAFAERSRAKAAA